MYALNAQTAEKTTVDVQKNTRATRANVERSSSVDVGTCGQLGLLSCFSCRSILVHVHLDLNRKKQGAGAGLCRRL